MAIIRSLGTVQSLAAPTPTYSTSSGIGGPWFSATYRDMYKTQPNVRTVVDFLARNVAQIGLKAYRRIDDNDREALPDHDVILWTRHPNPWTTRYRLFESTMIDLGIYLNAFWMKVRGGDGRIGLIRLPPEEVTVEGGLGPAAYIWQPQGRRVELPPSEIVHFGGHNPCNPLVGLSPLETLRPLLIESASASSYRAYFWRNAARMEGVIERPAAAPKWNKDQREAFRMQWQAAHAGNQNSGKTAILEDGMQWKDRSFSAKDSEFVPSRKLTREEVAAAYHVPLPMVGILDHATFSNIKEQHKQLYADCLGPWLAMIEEQIELQLLVEAADTEADGVYLEFNIAEKLKGSFEEQSDALMKLVGRPIMTANEGRARLNLSRQDDPSADELAQPLNQSTSSQAAADPAADPGNAGAAAIVARHRMRADARLAKVDVLERPSAFSLPRWTAELAEDLEAGGLATDAARLLSEQVNRAYRAELVEAADAAIDEAIA